MKTQKFLVCALGVLCLAVLAAGGCGGGGGDDERYEFGGAWAWTGTITASTDPSDVGDRMSDVMTIVQNGNSVTVTFPPDSGTTITMAGSCDPKAKTFSATGVTAGAVPGITFTISGTGVDDNTMTGTFNQSFGPLAISGTWTAELTSRAAGPAGKGSWLGF